MEDITIEKTMLVEVVENMAIETVTMIAIKVIKMAIDSQEKYKD